MYGSQCPKQDSANPVPGGQNNSKTKALVNGYSNNGYKGFLTLEEAEIWLASQHLPSPTPSVTNHVSSLSPSLSSSASSSPSSSQSAGPSSSSSSSSFNAAFDSLSLAEPHKDYQEKETSTTAGGRMRRGTAASSLPTCTSGGTGNTTKSGADTDAGAGSRVPARGKGKRRGGGTRGLGGGRGRGSPSVTVNVKGPVTFHNSAADGISPSRPGERPRAGEPF